MGETGGELFLLGVIRHGTGWDCVGQQGMVWDGVSELGHRGRGWQGRCQGGKSQCPTGFPPVPPSPTHPRSSPWECRRPHPKDTGFEGPVTPVRRDACTPVGRDVSLALPRSPPALRGGTRPPPTPPPAPSPCFGVFPVPQQRCSPAPLTDFCKSSSGWGETDVLWLPV